MLELNALELGKSVLLRVYKMKIKTRVQAQQFMSNHHSLEYPACPQQLLSLREMRERS